MTRFRTASVAQPPVPARETRRRKEIGLIWAALGVSLYIVCFDNNQFWWLVGTTSRAVEHPLVVSLVLFLLLFGAVNVSLALSVGVRGFKLTAAFLLVAASAVGFYMSEFGVAIDPSIIRSVAETDTREASTLLSGALFVHIALFGALPALVVLFAPLKRQSLTRDLITKTVLIVVSLLVPAIAIYSDYLEFSFYAQANRQVRLFMNPVYPLYATGQFFSELLASRAEPTQVVQTDVTRVRESDVVKPLAVVLVLGETARADHWSLNGYERATNRYTAGHDVVNFPDVDACGTSTADSLPCIFSPLSHDEFSHVTAARRENLLALLSRLSLDVLWIDNSTGCKNICAADEFVSIAGARDPALCDAHGCYDELLLPELERSLGDASADTFIVLHERGSHGPTYYENVPEQAKEFLPECTLDTFRDCDDASLINAYDNTILYSDRFLGEVIDYLESLQEKFDVALIYVSDHGESLGENGVYLHGFPYRLAPRSQTKVPMLFWASESFYDRSRVDRGCLRTASVRKYSHDAVFHTALGLIDARGAGYRSELDILAACRETSLMSMAYDATPDEFADRTGVTN